MATENKSLFKLKSTGRQCSICQGKKGEILHSQTFQLFENCKLLSSYDVVFCQNCGFVYADTSSSQQDYDDFYQNLSKYENDSTSSGAGVTKLDKERLERTATDIAKIVTNRSSIILDVGCVNGGLLTFLEKAGFSNLYGIDPSKNCVRRAKEHGLKVFQGGLFSDWGKFLEKGEKFDLIILSHVLEHIKDVKIAIGNLVTHLNKKGMFYVEVPDAEEYQNHLITPFYYFDPEHINHFDQNSLENLGANNGLVTVKTIKKLLTVADGLTYPAVGIFFRKDPAVKIKDKIKKDLKTKNSVLKHINDSKNKFEYSVIDNLSKSQQPVIVWGAGSFTQRLLCNSSLGACNIVSFIDNDSVKQGHLINGIKISSPKILEKLSNQPIIICSALHSADIVSEIESRGYKNPLIIVK